MRAVIHVFFSFYKAYLDALMDAPNISKIIYHICWIDCHLNVFNIFLSFSFCMWKFKS